MDEKVGRLLAFIGLRSELPAAPLGVEDNRQGSAHPQKAGEEAAAAVARPTDPGDQVERPDINPFLGAGGEAPALEEKPLEPPPREVEPRDAEPVEVEARPIDDADTDVTEAYGAETEAKEVEEPEAEHRQKDRDDDEEEGRGAGWVLEDREEADVEERPGLREEQALGDDIRCSGRGDDGARCLRRAVEGTPYCREHAATARTIESETNPKAVEPASPREEPLIGARGSRIIV